MKCLDFVERTYNQASSTSIALSATWYAYLQTWSQLVAIGPGVTCTWRGSRAKVYSLLHVNFRWSCAEVDTITKNCGMSGICLRGVSSYPLPSKYLSCCHLLSLRTRQNYSLSNNKVYSTSVLTSLFISNNLSIFLAVSIISTFLRKTWLATTLLKGLTFLEFLGSFARIT